MRKRNDDLISLIRRLESLLTVVVLSIAFFLVWRYFYRDESAFPYLGRGKYVLIFVYALITTLIFHFTECFRYGYLRLSAIIIAQAIATCIVNFVTYFQLCLMSNIMLSVWPMFILEGIDLVICFLICFYSTKIYHEMHVPRNLVMVYGDLRSLSLKLKMEVRPDKYRFKKLISSETPVEEILPQLSEYDAVILSDVKAELRNDILKYCYANKLRVYVVPKISDIVLGGSESITLFDVPLFLVKGKGLTLTQRFFKRAMDIVISGIALIILSPILLIVALLIKLEDHGPVFFKQDRVTKDHKVFNMIKFRSMVVDAEKYGAQPAVDKDPRITKIGRFIRATRLDEIPQLLNILKGDMSIVGPRPERVEHVEKYTAEIPEFAFREKVKGGLTGYAQIFGKYNTTAYDKLRLDLMYIEQYSLLLDLKLLLLTIQVMLKKESTEGFDKNITEEELLKMLEEQK